MKDTHDGLPLQGKPERAHLYDWVCEEETYVAGKFDDQRQGHDESLGMYGPDEFWTRQIVQYLDRASTFLRAAQSQRSDHASGPRCGEDHSDCREQARYLEMKGQQALAKGFMTFKGCVESSIRVFGPLPRPGVTSGVVEPWEDAPYWDGLGM